MENNNVFNNSESSGSSVPDKIATLTRRLALLDDRYANLNQKSEFLEQNMIEVNKEIRKEIKLLNSDILELKRTMIQLGDKINIALKEFGLLAKKEDVTILSRYIEYLSPLNFVTKEEIQKIIDEKTKGI